MILKLPRTFQPASRAIVASLLLAPTVLTGSARAASDVEAGRALPAATKLEADTYLVEIVPIGPYKAGQAGSVKVTLTTKGVFHINGQYPYRFKTASPPEGVSYPKPVLERADGQFAEKTATFQLPFVANHAGTFDVGGVLHMSVCSPNSCIVQKAPLNISVSVQ
jgi:hypothetical protein